MIFCKLGYRQKNIIILMSISFLALFIFSTCSPLYDINPWSDANVFFTIGRGALEGKKMYADLFDHKGPLLYFLYMIAAIISKTSFIGVFVLEVVNATLFLYFTQKIVNLYKKGNFYFYLLLLLIIFNTSWSFNFGGGSVEEYMLFFYTASLYIGLKNIHNNESFTRKQCIIIGIFIWSIFFMKFNLCGFYIGYAITVIIYQCQIDKKQISMCIKYAVSTFVLLSVITCALLYFYGVFSSFTDVYFKFNLFSYDTSNKINIVSNFILMVKKLLNTYMRYNLFFMPLLLITGILYLSSKNYSTHEKMFVICTLICHYVFQNISREEYYYIYPICAYAFVIILYFDSIKRKFIGVVLLGSLSIMAVINAPNIERIGKKDTIQSELDSIMKMYTSNPTLLTYGSSGRDEGFYLKEQYIPGCRYFTSISGSLDNYDDIIDECIEKDNYDFIIIMSKNLEDSFNTNIEGYSLLKYLDSRYLYDGVTRRYYLLINDNLKK